MKIDKIFFNSIIEATWLGSQEPCFDHCVFDSRKCQINSAFFALKGERVDGHDFVMEAYKNGARTFIISHKKREQVLSVLDGVLNTISIITVVDVLEALIALARSWRQQFSCPVIGITGSIGKTTTKETLVSILEYANKKYIATFENNNTLLSIATTLLSLRSEHEYAVIEMGVNKRGEMAKMADLVRPTMGIITGVMNSHAEGLGVLTDIAREKRDIFKYFDNTNIGIINGDQPLLAGISYAHPIVKFGFKTINQSQARKVNIENGFTRFILKLYGERYEITLSTVHSGPLMNALAAAASAHLLNIAHDVIIAGITKTAAVPGRFELKALPQLDGLIVNDCYNANPESMREALLAFGRLDVRGKKIAVLGDMLELGVNSPFWHRQLGRVLRKVPSLSRVIFVGNNIKAAEPLVPRSLPFSSVSNWQEAISELNKHLEPDVAVLVKASSGVGLKNLVEAMVTQS